ncbi:hypothetical protein C8J57DRAFT_1627782 [Mycena rebaudengoi]|nr:hypothetical protein C8J57DRAFT_1627782 [Mycena rebaudengoi]
MTPSSSDTLHLFPAEVWQRCWRLCSQRQLRRLSLVCRYFSSLCQPILFKNKKFIVPISDEVEPDDWMSGVRALHRDFLKLAGLAASPHASSVRSWYFSGGGKDLKTLVKTYPRITNIHLYPTTYLRIESAFITTLHSYRNLRSLHLKGLVIDASFRETLQGLSLLKDLNLQDCNIIARDMPLLPLQTFTMSHDRAFAVPRKPVDALLRIIVPDRVRCLRLEEIPDAVSLISSFGSCTLDHLVDLSLVYTDRIAPLLLPFLSGCPNLASLELEGYLPRMKHTFTRFPSDIIPKLTTFTGPCSIAPLFICDRPVRAVHLLPPARGMYPTSMVELITTLEQVARLTMPIQSLSIPLGTHSLELYACISSLFPCLRELSFMMYDASDLPEESVPPHVRAELDAFWSLIKERPKFEPDERSIDLWDDDDLRDLRTEELSGDEDQDKDVVVAASPLAEGSRRARMERMVRSIRERKLAAELGDEPMSTLNPISCIIQWICGRHIAALPPTLEVLRFRQTLTHFSIKAQHRAVVELREAIPLLKEVELGSRYCWTLVEGLWVHDTERARAYRFQ